MILEISLAQSQIADLKVILDVGSQPLQRVIDWLSGQGPVPLDPSGLESVVREVIPHPLGAPKSILKQALALHGLVKQRGESSPVLEAVTAAIQKEASWSGDEIARWTGLVPQLNELLNVQAIHLVSDTLEYLMNMKIFTPARVSLRTFDLCSAAMQQELKGPLFRLPFSAGRKHRGRARIECRYGRK
jgi:hypothetical protein